MSSYLGEYKLGSTMDFKFHTNDSSGALIDFGGTPAIGVLKANGSDVHYASVTLTRNFGGRVGNHHVRISLTDSFFEQGQDYQVIVGSGTLNSVPASGYTLREFSIGNRFNSANIVAASGDPSSAGNIRDMYNGTGYVDDTAPASRLQVSNIGAANGGSINFLPIEDNTGGAIIDSITFVGSVQGGTFASVGPGIGASHSINDTGNDIDIVYGFNVGGGRIATSVYVNADVDGGTDNLDIEIWNHVTSSWDTIGNIDDNNVVTIPITSAYTGTGSELGKVYIRFDNNNGTTPANLEVFELLVAAVNIGQTAGYSGGYLYFNSKANNENTEPFVDATADNPVSSWAAISTLLASTSLVRVDAVGDLTLTSSASGVAEIRSHRATLDLNGQNITNVEFINFKDVVGSGISTGGRPVFTDSILAINGRCYLPPSLIRDCEICASGIYATQAGFWDIVSCSSRVPGLDAPEIHFQDIENTFVGITDWDRGLKLSGLVETSTVSAHGRFNTLTLNGSSGTVAVQGQFGNLVNNLTNPSGVVVRGFPTRGATGYEGGVWVDEVNGTSTKTNVGFDGTFNERCDDFDNAQDIADALGANDIFITPGNSITLSDSLQGYTIQNVQATLNGGSQNVDSTRINGGFITGTWSRAGTGVPTFNTCNISNITSDRAAFLYCGLVGTITISEAGLYAFVECQAAGLSGVTTIDLDSFAATLNFERWSGNLTITGVAAGATINLHCVSGGAITIEGADGTVNITGTAGSVTDNRTGSPALSNNSVSPGVINSEADTAIADANLPSASGVADEILARTFDGYTLEECVKIFGSVLVGKVSGGRFNPVFRSMDDAEDRVTVTTDTNGNRITITINV